MYFDGAANHSGFGINVFLISPHGDHIPRVVSLAFSNRYLVVNNTIEDEAYILRLETIFEIEIREMEVYVLQFCNYTNLR